MAPVNNFINLTPDERAQTDIRIAMDSVNVVNEIVNNANTVHSEQIDTRVWANYKHLEIVLKRDYVTSYVTNNSVDVSALNNAINVGKTFVTNSAFVSANTI